MCSSNKNKVRWPAEWEQQSFLQLTFPHANSDWAPLLDKVSVCFKHIIEAAARFQKVLVVCDNIPRVRRIFPEHPNIFFAEIPSNDTWARDHGGITVLRNKVAVIQDYTFNGWGNKFASDQDNQITRTLFEQGLFKSAQLNSIDFVLEGGSVESDGEGTILTTTQCLLEKNRNPQYTQNEIEDILMKNLGARRVLWLHHGYLSGDDTDSHIDTLARFCSPEIIAYTACTNPNDTHFSALQNMKAELETFTTNTGAPYKLIPLPLPDSCYDKEGNRLPATYANFTIINGAVLLPVYDVKQDNEAIEIFENIFPDRKIIPINCRILIEQHGSLHCVTMQYPEAVKLNIEN